MTSRSFQFLVAPHASQTRTQSPTHESAVDVDEEMSTVSSQASVPAPPASTQTAGERAHSMEDACSAAIATYGGEASIKQITQWLNDQYDWFRRRSDSQDLVKETIMHNPLFVKVKGIRDKTSKRKAVLFTINQQYYSQHLAGTKETEDVDIDGVRGSPPLIISHPTQFAAAGVASPSDADEPLRPQQNPGTVSHPLRISMGDRLTKALERYSLPSSVIPPALNISLEPCHFSKKDQHIILREGELILNPKVFSDIPEDILARMSALDTEAVLEILQSEVKLYLKEQYRAVNGRGSGKYSRAQRHGRGRGRGRGRVDGHVEGAVVASPL
ncbi:uncharacterized protein EI90DRAFT_2331812 [Cantharellus anzutake]|uniref:uncharacterized protein n=1 Tax=Cantharellus anzutake TaxID=1750568 RepID=UPI001903F0AE|nr:uncharacterized protein EI90DRAFT_2331812 [Cantharellus anzutake]KAF8324417.1 hypothetical protein EI90DRAFT_2331812 [Cantharellus anzutake]